MHLAVSASVVNMTLEPTAATDESEEAPASSERTDKHTVIICVMHPADVELGRAVPIEAGAEVVVVGLKPRHSRFETLDVVASETARLLAARGVPATSVMIEYGSWPQAVDLLRQRRPSRVILPWRKHPDLEILAGRLRQHHFASLELFQPGPEVLATRLAWQVTQLNSRPWIP